MNCVFCQKPIPQFRAACDACVLEIAREVEAGGQTPALANEVGNVLSESDKAARGKVLARHCGGRETSEVVHYQTARFEGVVWWVSGPYPFSFATFIEAGGMNYQAVDGDDLGLILGCPQCNERLAHSNALSRTKFEQWLKG